MAAEEGPAEPRPRPACMHRELQFLLVWSVFAVEGRQEGDGGAWVAVGQGLRFFEENRKERDTRAGGRTEMGRWRERGREEVEFCGVNSGGRDCEQTFEKEKPSTCGRGRSIGWTVVGRRTPGGRLWKKRERTEITGS